MKSAFTALIFSLFLSPGFGQSPAPTHLRTDLLEHTDQVWKNGFLTNFTLEESASALYAFQTADIRSNRPYFSWVIC